MELIILILIGIIAILVKHTINQNSIILAQNSTISTQNSTILSLNSSQVVVIDAKGPSNTFNEVEAWRMKKSIEIYENATIEEMKVAKHWLQYSEFEINANSCGSIDEVPNDAFISLYEDFLSLSTWNDTCRKMVLTLHSYHTTGIEGNTLTLSETGLIIDQKPLYTGYRDDFLDLAPLISMSLIEIRNIKLVLDSLGFSRPPSDDITWSMSLQKLVDINSAIIKDTNTSIGFRTHNVAIGHQKIILPDPLELPYLLDLYLHWLNSSIRNLLQGLEPMSSDKLFHSILSLACDAHTRFVHIHPFSDGNGRLARIISGLVLQVFHFPPPMFLKESRVQYIQAVASNTIHKDPIPICRMHREAVYRSMKMMIDLSNHNCPIVFFQ